MGNKPYQKFRARYKIQNLIANGYFANVYRIYDQEEKTTKIQKVSINPIHLEDRQKIVQEPKIFIKLNHPQVIRGYDYIISQQPDKFQKNQINFHSHFVMEYFQGKPLEEYLGKLNKEQILDIYKQIKSALKYLFRQKIICIDISLDNILVDANTNIRITNLGISNYLKEDKYKFDNRKTEMSYKTPESFQFKVSLKSDLWRLGIIILQLFLGNYISKLYDKIPGNDKQFPSRFYDKYGSQLPKQIMRVVEPLLQRDCANRKFYEGLEQTQQIEDQIVTFKHIKTSGRKLTTKMTELCLDSRSINSEGIKQIIEYFNNLIHLDLNNNNIVTQDAIQLAKKFKNLRVLWLNNNKIQTQGTIEIAKNLRNLTSLLLCDNSIQSRGAIEIAKNLKYLHELDLSFNNIGNDGAVHIAKNLKHLSFLNLNSNNIGTEASIQIAKNLTNLSGLYLSNNNISNQGGLEIAKNLINLTYLDISNNRIKIESGIQLIKYMKNIHYLNLKNNQINQQGRTQLKIVMPSIEI